MQGGLVGARLVRVALAVEDGQCDILPNLERLLEGTRVLDLHDLEAGHEQLRRDRDGLVGWKGDDDGWTGHGSTPRRSVWGQSPASGSCAATSRPSDVWEVIV